MDILSQFNGFLKTPPLWLGDDIYGMTQHEITSFVKSPKLDFDPKLRIGKLVEQFVFEVINKDITCELIAENIQIRKEKLTIGEIDCLVRIKEEFTHLEIVYKFYLFDPKLQNSNLSPWIGPNRKDSFLQKLNKLKHHQLPLISRQETLNTLNRLVCESKFNKKNSSFLTEKSTLKKNTFLNFNNALQAGAVKQKVLFKGQLFVPKDMLNSPFSLINTKCIAGFYLNIAMLSTLDKNLFFIPEKRDWLVDPINEILWIAFSEFKQQINEFMEVKRSPLCWIKPAHGTMQKFFVVWW